ncbi:WD repeat-containing protein 76-like [Xenia sp. Carnegie-2017]|uniref:WD repeat-containing protein 76-like n=1 Tax=Xenia sp. Carnegie-2017 TaxID=2897299 RepID=UPI001F048873|nr:WD repeat-containing protein 76-like [Xenia sp. Carnegie-2017]
MKRRTSTRLQQRKLLKLEVNYAEPKEINSDEIDDNEDNDNTQYEESCESSSSSEDQSDDNDVHEMSEYEKQRLANIRKNKELLDSLKINEEISHLRARKQPTKLKRPVMKKKVVEPVRRSPRISKERASNQFEMITLPDLRIYPAVEERIKGPVDANPINDVGDDANKKFMNSLELLSNETKMTTNVVPVEASFPQSYKQRISKFSLTSDRIRKVVPKRITTMAFHPCCDKTIVAAGDNAGNIGIWNVDASKEDDDVIMYRPHAGNVRQVYFHPFRNNSLFSSSVDGSLRRADFNSCTFEEIYATDDHMINGFSCPLNSRDIFLLAHDAGYVGVLDTRETKNEVKTHVCHGKNVKCIDSSSSNEYLFCTSSSDATVALWDLRNLKGIKSSLDTFEKHSRSISSSYFSPGDGKYILTTCWDDTVKVLEVTSSWKLEMKRNFQHYNHTNRWLTPFKASWDTRRGRGFVIGSLLYSRRIQFYHVEQMETSPLLEKFDPNFTTITSINVFHPTRSILGAGNSSGKIYIWSD